MSNWTALPRLAGLRITGPDALAFCQAQFTADFRQIEPGGWQITAWCDAKGRCLMLILASIDEDGVELIVPASRLESMARLKLFSIGRQVDISPGHAVAGRFDAARDDRLIKGSQPARALRLMDSASNDTEIALAWRIADLAQPIPWLDASQSGRFLPQALGLEDNGGLSYRKGCYPGQEVIARVHYLGRAKQHLLGFRLAVVDYGPTPALERLQDDQGTERAEVIDQVRIGQEIIGLAVAPSTWQDGHEVSSAGSDQPCRGSMVATRALCYYQPHNDDKHGTNQ
jgi:folate-binding protein YgfZ